MTRQRSTKDSETFLKIGEVARRTGVTLRTIRDYQSPGLIRAACRTTGGKRHYHPEPNDRAQFIRDLCNLGVPLGVIGTVLEAEQGTETGAERARRACSRCACRPSRAGRYTCENLVHLGPVPVYIRALVN